MGSEEDMTEVLITEIQARPALWNTKLPSYKNRHLRDQQYAEIAEILGISKEAVAARWKNRKDKYRRELKKYPILHSGDGAENYKSTWPYFQMMSFLKDLLIPAVKSGNLPTFDEHSHHEDDGINSDLEGEKSNRTDTQSVIDSSHEEERASSVSASSISSQQRKGNRKRLCDIRDEKFLEVENKKLQLLSETLKHDANEPESEELLFFKSLIPYMATFNPIQKLKVRNKIQEVILNELSSTENRDKNIPQYAIDQNSNNLTLLSSQNPQQSGLPSDNSAPVPFPAYPPQYRQYQY